MNYLHGRKLRAVLEDEPGYYYEGRFAVNQWTSDKNYSKVTIDYDVGPYKWEYRGSLEDWEWNPFSFETGIIPDSRFRNISLTTSWRTFTYPVELLGRAPTCPVFLVSSNPIYVIYTDLRERTQKQVEIPAGTTQVNSLVFAGEEAIIKMRSKTGRATVSIDFKRGGL